MKDTQFNTLNVLKYCAEAATENGLFDLMAAYIHPDVINTFCDAIDEMLKAEKPNACPDCKTPRNQPDLDGWIEGPDGERL